MLLSFWQSMNPIQQLALVPYICGVAALAALVLRAALKETLARIKENRELEYYSAHVFDPEWMDAGKWTEEKEYGLFSFLKQRR